MHLHVAGICGTFMAGIAVLARQLGHEVSGTDVNIYPPMSDQLKNQGITLYLGYDPKYLSPKPDLVIIGNALSRGNPIIESILNQGIPYISGPQWLAENVLQNRHVLAVAGTHGKTTTTSLLTWILEHAGLNPGFLIGGIPENFGVSARLGKNPFFVVEADEYDSAFFDKRSKFLHYRPKTAVLNNLEYDHADIFPDLKAIKQQFHYLIRTIPNNGLILTPSDDVNLQEVVQMGCWTPISHFGTGNERWSAQNISPSGDHFDLYFDQKKIGSITWSLIGNHNVQNALAAIAAAHHVGVAPENAIEALSTFKNVKRRMEIKGVVNQVTVYDDFAHHPTAIATTLAGLRGRVGKQRILAVVELGSYTMRSGAHKDHLLPALKEADQVLFARPKGPDWGIDHISKSLPVPSGVYDDVKLLIEELIKTARPNDHILIMSNASFDGIYDKLLSALGR